MKGGITMSIYDGVRKAFEQTLLTDKRRVKPEVRLCCKFFRKNESGSQLSLYSN